jgi:hypothetical protein
MSEKYPLRKRLREEIFSQLIRDQWGPYGWMKPEVALLGWQVTLLQLPRLLEVTLTCP